MFFSLLSHIGRVCSCKMIIFIRKKTILLFHYVYSGAVGSRLQKKGKRVLFHASSTFTGLENIEIGDNYYSGRRLRLEAISKYEGMIYHPKIQFGNNVKIENDCHIACVNSITIEDNVLIAGRVFITDHFHGSITHESLQFSPTKRPLFSKGPIVIKKNAWIGEGVAIMPDVVIGENCIVGANAVVTKSFPDNSVIAGNPARCIKVLQDK